MKAFTTTTFTEYSNSPVITVANSRNFSISLAIDENGNIYRFVKSNCKTKESEEANVFLSEKSVELLNDFENCKNYEYPILYSLETIQKYFIQLHSGSVNYYPLHELDLNLISFAKKGLEIFEENKNLSKRISQSIALNSERAKENILLKAQVKAGTNDKKVVALVLGGTKLKSKLNELFENKIVYPNGYTGSGKFSKKGTDWVGQISDILNMVGIKFTTGNNAPKSGFSGNFIKIK